MSRIAIDPVTRIEGHLRLEIETAAGSVKDVWSTGTMFRGIERILNGRDPLTAWQLAQRVCGVCTHVHGLASVRAVENALGVTVPSNARILRNVMHAVQIIHDHVVHFYHLHLPDWADVTITLKADPAKTAELAAATNVGWANNGVEWFKSVQDRLKKLAESRTLGPFTNGYWGHSAHECTPEEALLFYAHYLEALDFQREVVKIHAYIGGKNPHPQTYLVGGMSSMFHPDAPSGTNAANLIKMREIAAATKRFVEQLYVPDMILLAKRYKKWFGYGQGLGNLLSYGDLALTEEGEKSYLFPAGRIKNRDLAHVHSTDSRQVAETVARSWYSYKVGDKNLLPPAAGETEPRYDGPKPPYEMIGDAKKYSWLKAPRYETKAYEVGPLARLLIGYAAGKEPFRTVVKSFMNAVGIPVEQMFSTMGRLAARALETQVITAHLDSWLGELQANQAAGKLEIATKLKPSTEWGSVKGYGLVEAPRGSLGHWVYFKGNEIKNYQMVVPTTWNGSPRDAKGQRGAWEQAIIGNPLADPQQPLEVLRTVHSFDPCMGCSVHMLNPDGNDQPLAVIEVV